MESELKFVIPDHQLTPALSIIEALCVEDTQHPAANIFSIYYDSQVFDSLNEKINSDYYKSKVRLRWYQDNVSKRFSETAYAEAKFRIGAQRQKHRVISDLKPQDLAAISLDDDALNSTTTHLLSKGVIINKPLFPTLLIQYQRRRFVDPISGNRISIDNNIQTPRWNQRMMPGASAAKLQTAVIEIKGNQNRGPQNLHILTQFGVRKSSFSKYLSCRSRCHQVTFDPR